MLSCRRVPEAGDSAETEGLVKSAAAIALVYANKKEVKTEILLALQDTLLYSKYIPEFPWDHFNDFALQILYYLNLNKRADVIPFLKDAFAKILEAEGMKSINASAINALALLFKLLKEDPSI